MHYMHYKDYIHHDFYVYSPVLLTQYLGHCWHTPCTELYILRISAWLLRKPPLPCHRGGEPSGWVGGGVGVPAHIYIYMFEIQCKQNEALDYTMRSCDGPNVSWLFQFQCSWWQGYIMFPVMMVVIMPS